MIRVQTLIDENLVLIEQQVKPLLSTNVTELSKYLISNLINFKINILTKLKTLKDDSIEDSLEIIILLKLKKEILLLKNSLENNSNFKNFQAKIILIYFEYELLNENLNNSWNFLSEKFKLYKVEQREIQTIREKLASISNISEIEPIIDMISKPYLQSANRRIEKLRIVEQELISSLKENYRDEFKIYFLSSIGRGRLNFIFSLFNSYHHDKSENPSTNLKYIMRNVLICNNIQILSQKEIDSLFFEVSNLASKSKSYAHFYFKLKYLGTIFRFGKLSNLTYEKLHNILSLLNEINKLMKEELFFSFLEFELNEIIRINHLFIKSDEDYQTTFISFLELLSKQKLVHQQKLIIRNFLLNKQLLDDSDCITINSLKILEAKNFADNCSDLDEHTKNIFENVSRINFNKYILIKSNSIFLGHIKLKGINTFLSYVDIKDSKGNIILLKGLVYGINKKFEKKLRIKKLELPNNKLLAIDLNIIKLTPLRLINLDLLTRIDKFIINLEQIDKYQITTLNQKKFFFHEYFSNDRN